MGGGVKTARTRMCFKKPASDADFQHAGSSVIHGQDGSLPETALLDSRQRLAHASGGHGLECRP